MKEMIMKTCPLCGKEETHEYPVGGLAKYFSGVNVQDALPECNAFEREFLITGFCFDCQSKTFNRPKPGEDWGKLLGNCECCGAPIWEKDGPICKSCGGCVG